MPATLNERAGRELIPASIIERPPSAELRDDQRDDQSLPPYEELDPLLEAYVEDDLSPEEIAARAASATLEVAERVARLVDLAEYKRRQAPPGHQACTPRPSAATGACRSRTASCKMGTNHKMGTTNLQSDHGKVARTGDGIYF